MNLHDFRFFSFWGSLGFASGTLCSRLLVFVRLLNLSKALRTSLKKSQKRQSILPFSKKRANVQWICMIFVIFCFFDRRFLGKPQFWLVYAAFRWGPCFWPFFRKSWFFRFFRHGDFLGVRTSLFSIWVGSGALPNRPWPSKNNENAWECDPWKIMCVFLLYKHVLLKNTWFVIHIVFLESNFEQHKTKKLDCS